MPTLALVLLCSVRQSKWQIIFDYFTRSILTRIVRGCSLSKERKKRKKERQKKNEKMGILKKKSEFSRKLFGVT